MNYNNKFFKYNLAILLILLIFFFLGQIEFILIPLKGILTIILLPFIGAGLFYYLLRPIVRYLDKKKVNRTVAVIGIFLIIIAFIAIFIVYGGSFLKEEFRDFYDTFSKQLQIAQKTTQNILNEGEWWIFSIQDLEDKSIAALDLGFRKLGENIASWIAVIANAGTVIVLIPFVAFFLLKDDKLFYKNIMSVIPGKHEKTAKKLLKEIDNTLSIYITGQLIVAMFLGALTYVGYLIIGLPNAFILAVFSMVTSIIPFLGPFLGVLPAIFIGFTIDFFMIIKIFIVLILVQQLEGNLIRPNIMGNRLQIHPLTIIFLVIIAISLYGFVGAFIAIPVYGVIRVIVRHYIGEYLSRN